MIQEIIDKIEKEIELRKNTPHNHEQVDICYGLNRAKDIVSAMPESGWIPVAERLPTENENRAVCSTHSNKPFLKRLEIAYITDTTEYQFGYYDGYKWLDKCNKEIPNIVAWKIHEPFNPQN